MAEFGVYEIAKDVAVLLADFEEAVELKAGRFEPATAQEAAAAQHLTSVAHAAEGDGTTAPLATVVEPPAPAVDQPAPAAEPAAPGPAPAPTPTPAAQPEPASQPEAPAPAADQPAAG